MGGDRDMAGPGTRGKVGAQSRKERLAQALRANLKRRKRPSSPTAGGRKAGNSEGSKPTRE